MSRLCLCCCILLALGLPSAPLYGQSGPGRSHDRLAGIREAYNVGDFEQTLLLIGQVERAGDLSTGELVELLEIRALVHWPLRDDAESAEVTRRTLRQLSALAPGHRSQNFGPELQRQLDSLGESAGVSWRLSCTAGSQPRLEAELRGETYELLQRVSFRARNAGSSEWLETTAEGPVATLPTVEGSGEVHVEALAHGPGATLIPATGGAAVLRCGEEGGGGNTALWVAVGAGSAVAIAAAVTAAVLVSQGGDDVLGEVRLR